MRRGETKGVYWLSSSLKMIGEGTGRDEIGDIDGRYIRSRSNRDGRALNGTATADDE